MIDLFMHSVPFYLKLYGIRHIVKDHFQLTARDLDTLFYCIYHISETLTKMKNRTMGPPGKFEPTTHCTTSDHFIMPHS